MANYDELACTADAELFSPRGLEARVAALACLRSAVWWRLPARARLLLEVADYLGLEQACGLHVTRLDTLLGTLPEQLRQRCLSLAGCQRVAGPVFADGFGGSIETQDVVAWISEGFGSEGSDSLMSP